MSETNRCPHCRQPVPLTALRGLCPECLVRMAASPPGGPGSIEEVSPGLNTELSPAEIARCFPHMEISECLGRGGMGVVYKARQPQLDRVIACKVLSPERCHDPQFAERFAREAKALARLHHPNIVAVYDFGETNGLHYLLMEYVDGASLRQTLKSRMLSPAEALAIIPRLCEALQYAHQRGIVHRDIKPENILIDRQGQVKIADFGIAKIMGDPPLGLTQDQHAIGTPHYMAPEQIEAPQQVDHRADIYSLGVVFYELLTGELPLGKFALPSQKVPVDGRLDEVVSRALAKDPEHRYQRAGQVKDELETIIARAGAVPPGSSRMPPSSGRPRWVWPAMASVIGVLIVALATLLLLKPAIWPYEQPYVISGKITDEYGVPMEGVRVSVICWEREAAPQPMFRVSRNTDSTGRYLVQFGTAPTSANTTSQPTSLRVIKVMAEKAGYYELTLGQSGYLALLEPDVQDLPDARFAGVIRSRRVCRVNLVLKPAATIQGMLVDETAQPIRNAWIGLNGSTLGPRQNILKASRTDGSGRFAFEGVPPGREWWIQLGVGDQPGARYQSLPYRIPAAQTYRLIVSKTALGSLNLRTLPPGVAEQPSDAMP